MPIKRYQRGSHPYHSYRARVSIPKQKRFRKRRVFLWLLLLFVVVVVGVTYWRYSRPLPEISPQVTYVDSVQVAKINVEWGDSQAAFGTIEQGVVAEKERQIPRPTASTAKLITVLTVLEKKPLSAGEQGPRITMTQADVDLFNKYVAIEGSTAQVEVGGQLSEYQMIQATLLPSANNIADTLAIWAFGSLENYQKAAQKYVESIGATRTTIGSDASGFAPDTISTASDLTKIGIEAAKHPVVAEIMSQKSVTLPVAGEKHNTNWLLGEDGVVGGKTGNTDEAGGVFVFVSRQAVGKYQFTMVGAVQGEATVQNAILASEKIIERYKDKFSVVTPIRKGQVVGEYTSLWGSRVDAVSGSDIEFVSWSGSVWKPQITLDTIQATPPSGSRVGSIVVNHLKAPIILDGSLDSPTTTWRIFSSF